MITAATDAAVRPRRLGRGAVNYLVKPFGAAELADRLRAYAGYRDHMRRQRPLDQAEIDRAVRLLREGDRIGERRAQGPLGPDRDPGPGGAAPRRRPAAAADVARPSGLSRATAQRYLADLADDGRVVVALRYGTTGRPEHLYRWPDFPAKRRGHPADPWGTPSSPGRRHQSLHSSRNPDLGAPASPLEERGWPP